MKKKKTRSVMWARFIKFKWERYWRGALVVDGWLAAIGHAGFQSVAAKGLEWCCESQRERKRVRMRERVWVKLGAFEDGYQQWCAYQVSQSFFFLLCCVWAIPRLKKIVFCFVFFCWVHIWHDCTHVRAVPVSNTCFTWMLCQKWHVHAS